MRLYSVIAAILVIVSSAPTSAQESHLDDRERIEQMAKRYSEYYNNQDAAAVASLFSKDGVRVSPGVNAEGPDAIEDTLTTEFKLGFSHVDVTVDQVSTLGADAAIKFGKYGLTGQGQSGALSIEGNWTEVDVREKGVWKIRLL